MAKSCRHFKSFHAAPRRFALLTGPWGRTGKVRYNIQKPPLLKRRNQIRAPFTDLMAPVIIYARNERRLATPGTL
jgi:hypothetical protein